MLLQDGRDRFRVYCVLTCFVLVVVLEIDLEVEHVAEVRCAEHVLPTCELLQYLSINLDIIQFFNYLFCALFVCFVHPYLSLDSSHIKLHASVREFIINGHVR